VGEDRGAQRVHRREGGRVNVAPRHRRTLSTANAPRVEASIGARAQRRLIISLSEARSAYSPHRQHVQCNLDTIQEETIFYTHSFISLPSPRCSTACAHACERPLYSMPPRAEMRAACGADDLCASRPIRRRCGQESAPHRASTERSAPPPPRHARAHSRMSLITAPLVGASDVVWRALLRRHSARIVYTQMIEADRLCHDAQYRREVAREEGESHADCNACVCEQRLMHARTCADARSVLRPRAPSAPS
jgi:hypothetical protein